MSPEEMRERLSAWLEGELSAGEREELERRLRDDPALRDELKSLERLRAACAELGGHPPPSHLWPRIRARLHPPAPAASARRRALALRGAAAVFVFLAGYLAAFATAGRPRPAGPAASLAATHLLILHDDLQRLAALSPEERGFLVQRYGEWARREAAEGRVVDGHKLADPRWSVDAAGRAALPPLTEVDGIGGLFLVRAATDQQALEIAEQCPHRDHGWIEVRRLDR